MTPAQIESVTLNILRQLDEVHPLGMKASSLLTGCHEDDLRFVAQADIDSLLSDLQEQGLVTLKDNKAVPEMKRFMRTVQARAFLAEHTAS